MKRSRRVSARPVHGERKQVPTASGDLRAGARPSRAICRLGAGLLVVHLDEADARLAGGHALTVMGEPARVNEGLARQMGVLPIPDLLPVMRAAGRTWTSRREETSC